MTPKPNPRRRGAHELRSDEPFPVCKNLLCPPPPPSPSLLPPIVSSDITAVLLRAGTDGAPSAGSYSLGTDAKDRRARARPSQTPRPQRSERARFFVDTPPIGEKKETVGHVTGEHVLAALAIRISGSLRAETKLGMNSAHLRSSASPPRETRKSGRTRRGSAFSASDLPRWPPFLSGGCLLCLSATTDLILIRID